MAIKSVVTAADANVVIVVVFYLVDRVRGRKTKPCRFIAECVCVSWTLIVTGGIIIALGDAAHNFIRLLFLVNAERL